MSVKRSRSHAVTGIEEAELLAVGHDLREQRGLERVVAHPAHAEQELGDRAPVDAHRLPHAMHHQAVAHPQRRLERELLPLAQLRGAEPGVVLLERQHAERDVPGLVGHHVAQELLQERLLGDLVHEPEGGERQALDHDLHAHVRHVPARVADDVVDEQLQRGVDRVVAVELRVEVAREDLDVTGFVHDLGRRVVLGVDPRRRRDDLRRADRARPARRAGTGSCAS